LPAESVIDNARQAEKVQKGRQIAIALDTKGPEIRTGNTKDDVDIPIEAGTIMNFTTNEEFKQSCDTKNM
jgi:pyruvate kinase